MALQKDYTYKGVVCNYWKIENVTNNYRLGQTHVTLSLYPTALVRDDSVDNIQWSVAVVVFSDILTEREDIYEALKGVNTPLDTQDENGDTVKFFTDAVDV